MKFTKVGTLVVLFGALAIVISSCRKDARTHWDTELLVPIATTSLNMQNLVRDSALRTNADSTFTLAFNKQLYHFNLADQLIHIPDTAIGQKFTLDSLKLPSQTISYRYTLLQMINNLIAGPEPGHTVGFILSLNLGGTSAIPAINNINIPANNFNAALYFDSAYLISGEIQVWAVNHLPIPISGGTAELFNSDDTVNPIATHAIPYINPYDSVAFTIPVGGLRVTNSLVFKIVNLSTPGSGGVQVPIIGTDYVEMRMYITGLHASEAWAKFPAQNVVDITQDLTQVIADRKFTYVDARTGSLHVFITSSIQEQLYLEYTLVGAYDNHGLPLKEYTVVPPAQPNVPVTIDTFINMAGFAISLTGKDGSQFNTYTQRVVAHIDSDGITHHITRNDSLHLRYEITEVRPNYIKGYFGRDTITSNDSADFNFLNIFQSGSMDLESVNMNFTVDNGLGVDGQVKINGLTAISSINGTRALSGTIVGQPLVIGRATDFPLTPSHNTFAINNSNSNIKDLIGILPNKLRYIVEVRTNINGNNQTYRDFAYLESNLNIGMSAEIPLSLIANSLTLRDTIDFNISRTNTNVKGITDGVLNIITENKYPVDAVLTMVIYDSTWTAVDTLLMNQRIAAGDLDAGCRVDYPKKTKIPEYINEQRMDRIKLGRKAIIIASFSTPTNSTNCNGQHIKIYSDYNLGITFIARFNYKATAKF